LTTWSLDAETRKFSQKNSRVKELEELIKELLSTTRAASEVEKTTSLFLFFIPECF
jgi:hypothetical protein